jgi:hypothetical protein
MRTTILAVLAAGLVFLAVRLTGGNVSSSGVYQSVDGTQFYDDPRDIRPALAYDLERAVYGSNRPITGGTIEPMGSFELEKTVPYGARIRVLSGRYRGDRGWIKSQELTRARRVETLPRKDHSR